MANKGHQLSIDDLVDSMRAEVLMCRDLSHAWQPHSAARLNSGWERVLRCAVCRTKRRETLSASGSVLRRNYEYPDGFLAPPGYGRLTSRDRDAIRLADMRNTYAEITAQPTRRKKAS